MEIEIVQTQVARPFVNRVHGEIEAKRIARVEPVRGAEIREGYSAKEDARGKRRAHGRS